MNLSVKIPQNGRNKAFGGKQATSRVSLFYLDVKTLKGRYD